MSLVQKKRAFVEVTYTDDGPSMAGAISYFGKKRHATVIEVEAETEREAERLASDRITQGNLYVGGVQARFIRWSLWPL